MRSVTIVSSTMNLFEKMYTFSAIAELRGNKKVLLKPQFPPNINISNFIKRFQGIFLY